MAFSVSSLLRRSFSSSASSKPDVFILSAVRTPVGAFGGSLSSVSAVQLGSTAVSAAVSRAGIQPNEVNEVILGNVLSAGLGQAPSTQVSHGAGIPFSTPTWSLNKVCSSGLKAVSNAGLSIRHGDSQVIVAGGFESMSNAPWYISRPKSAFPYGAPETFDSVLKDGLMDAFAANTHMGNCAEVCAKEYKITREDSDKYAIESYRRAVAAQKAGHFKNEIATVSIKDKKGEITVADDEEPGKLKADKVPTLRSAFQKDGTVTAANASKLNDGAAALVLSNSAFAAGRKPLARILAWADAQKPPVEFTTAPTLAIPLAVQRAGLRMEDIDLFEINEAFSVVAIACAQLLKLDLGKVNVNGGAVAIGHPIGASGARILVTLTHALHQRKGKYGVAAICNGGGGATAVVIERL